MNPDDRPLLDGACTEACEQTFSWLCRCEADCPRCTQAHFESLDRYKAAAKHMNKESYIFFHLRLADLHNKWLISQAKPTTQKNQVQLETCRQTQSIVIAMLPGEESSEEASQETCLQSTSASCSSTRPASD